MADDDFAQRRALEDEWIAVRCQLGERAAFDELIQTLARANLARCAAPLRRRKDAVVVADIDEADRHEIPDPMVADELEHELIAMEQHLSRLPPIEREALTLFYLRELSLQEIAQALDIPVGTVKSRLHRARRMLRRELTSKGDVS